MLLLQLFEFRDDQIKRLVPRCALKPAVTFDKRIKKTIRMVNLKISRHAFWTEAAFVDGEIIARLEAYDVVVLYKQVHAALHCAVWTVRRHNLVNDAVSAP